MSPKYMYFLLWEVKKINNNEKKSRKWLYSVVYHPITSIMVNVTFIVMKIAAQINWGRPI